MILEIDNAKYAGFVSLSVVSSMDTLSDTFSISANNRWIRDYEIGVNSTCRILTEPDEEPILDGFIYGLRPEIGNPVSITGRDKTGDLIDCTVSGSTGEFRGRTPKQIITSLCEPFGVSVSGAEGTALPVYRHSQNETVYDIILDLATRQGLLINSDGAGEIVITTAATTTRAPFVLQEGVNIIDGGAILDASMQHSTYTVIGQNADDNQVTASVDGESPRFRPMKVINSGAIQISDAMTAAAWRQSISDGMVQSYSVKVAGIQNVRPNTLIEIASDTLGVNGDLLIRKAVFTTDSNGSTTTLSLVPPQTFGGDETLNRWIK
jgi:prophage tail gpP-like protein